MKVLITGIHGFVGSNLVEKLKTKHELYGLDIVTPHKGGLLKTYQWDELDNIPDVNAIIHLAGMAHDTKNRTKSDVYFEINTGLTQKIFDWFLQSSANKFIYFSSVKAAADSVKTEPLTENVTPSPIGPYGESKIKAEEYILSKQDEVNKLGKKYYILRPCMIHGEGNKGNLNLLYSVVKKGIPWPLGSFDNRRSFCSIDNLIYVVDSLLDIEVQSGIYNICDDETISTNDLIRLICDSLQKKTRIWKVPQRIMLSIAKAGTILFLPLNSERLKKLTENYVVSNVKIKKALKITNMPITAFEGMVKTLKSFQK